MLVHEGDLGFRESRNDHGQGLRLLLVLLAPGQRRQAWQGDGGAHAHLAHAKDRVVRVGCLLQRQKQ